MQDEDPEPKPEWARIAIDAMLDTNAIRARVKDLCDTGIEQDKLIRVLSTVLTAIDNLQAAATRLTWTLERQEMRR
jgi:hypothetical protein